MKCPNCGKWNQASLPHCIYCGQELPTEGAYGPGGVPAWQLQLEDMGTRRAARQWDPHPLPPAGSHVTGRHVGPWQGPRFHGKQAAFSVRAVPPAPPSKQFQQPLQSQRTSKTPA